MRGKTYFYLSDKRYITFSFRDERFWGFHPEALSSMISQCQSTPKAHLVLARSLALADKTFICGKKKSYSPGEYW